MILIGLIRFLDTLYYSKLIFLLIPVIIFSLFSCTNEVHKTIPSAKKYSTWGIIETNKNNMSFYDSLNHKIYNQEIDIEVPFGLYQLEQKSNIYNSKILAENTNKSFKIDSINFTKLPKHLIVWNQMNQKLQLMNCHPCRRAEINLLFELKIFMNSIHDLKANK